MLDDISEIHKYDKSNALGIIAGQPGQLKQSYGVSIKDFKPSSIVVAGMGGSALAAEFIKSWLGNRLPIPLEIVRDYKLPGYVSDRTLVIASSYSGNTEESLSALQDAESRGANIIVISSGGQLAEAAKAKQYPHFILPAGFQPRLAVLYGVRALAEVLEQLKLVNGVVAELLAAADWVDVNTHSWMADSPEAQNTAKQIAMELHNHAAVIYGGPTLALPAMKWKIDINENAKNVAFYNLLPEFNHNEFNGWIAYAPEGLKVVELQSGLDHPQISKRFSVTNRLLSGKMPKPIEVVAAGDTKIQQMLWTLLLGDFVSAYLAFLNGIDPTPVDLIEKLKKELSK